MKAPFQVKGWSCIADAFASALGIPVANLIDKIGHTESHGFHVQECIEVAVNLGFACTPIELVPQALLTPTSQPRAVWFPQYKLSSDLSLDWGDKSGNVLRLYTHMRGNEGVLTGQVTSGIGHAVNWHNNEIWDTRERGFAYKFGECDANGFHPQCFWKVQKVPT